MSDLRPPINLLYSFPTVLNVYIFLPIGNIVCTQRNDVFTTYTVIFWGLDCRQRLTIALWKESQLIMSTQHDEASGKR